MIVAELGVGTWLPAFVQPKFMFFLLLCHRSKRGPLVRWFGQNSPRVLLRRSYMSSISLCTGSCELLSLPSIMIGG